MGLKSTSPTRSCWPITAPTGPSVLRLRQLGIPVSHAHTAANRPHRSSQARLRRHLAAGRERGEPACARIDYVHLPRRLLGARTYRIGQFLGSAVGGTLT